MSGSKDDETGASKSESKAGETSKQQIQNADSSQGEATKSEGTALALRSPAQLPAPLEASKDLGTYAERWRQLPAVQKKEKRPEFRGLIVDYEDESEANKTRGVLASIVAGSVGGSFTVTGGGLLASKVAAGATITAAIAAPVVFGAVTLLGGLWIASYFYKTGRQQQKTAKKATIVLEEGSDVDGDTK